MNDPRQQSAIGTDWAVGMRQGMPSSTRWAYLDHAAVAPLPSVAAEAINDWVADALANGATDWGHWRDRVERLRCSAAAAPDVARTRDSAVVRCGRR